MPSPTDKTVSLSDVDLTRSMRTSDELRGLIEAIHGSLAGTQETNCVEWKNRLDVTTPAGKFAVAKAIIGFSKRSVEQALFPPVRFNANGSRGFDERPFRCPPTLVDSIELSLEFRSGTLCIV